MIEKPFNLLALVLGLIILVTFAGNVLVCLSVIKVRKLRHPSNYLLISLAISDLCVACVVMPFGLYVSINDNWQLGKLLCNVYVVSDVTSCTASILNLCVISIDRYLAITRPLTYCIRRTTRLMLILIGAVWVLACLISVPPLLISGNEYGTESEPRCEVSQSLWYQLYATCISFYIPLIVMICLYYNIYTAAKRVVDAEMRATTGLQVTKQQHHSHSHSHAHSHSHKHRHHNHSHNHGHQHQHHHHHHQHHHLHQHSNQHHQHHHEPHSDHRHRSHHLQLHLHQPKQRHSHKMKPPNDADQQQQQQHQSHFQQQLLQQPPPDCNTISPAQESKPNAAQTDSSSLVQPIPEATECDPNNTDTNNNNTDESNNNDHGNNGPSLAVTFAEANKRKSFKQCQRLPSRGARSKKAKRKQSALLSILPSNLPSFMRHFRPNRPTVANCPADCRHPCGQQHHCCDGPAGPLDNGQQNTQLLNYNPVSSSLLVSGSSSSSASSCCSCSCDHCSGQQADQGAKTSGSGSGSGNKASSAMRERKASVTLGVIMSAFTICWLPFFIIALLRPFSETVNSLPRAYVLLTLWLGYANSLLNPIIYVTFHHDFRNAFKHLLCLRCMTINEHIRKDEYKSQYGETHYQENKLPASRNFARV